MEEDDFLIPISVFENKDDNQPSRHDLGWHALARRLFRYDERLTKDGRAWSPVTYLPGTTRGKSNVDQVFALTLDIDHSVDGLPLDLLEGREYAAHTTHSHTPEAPRWRVVLPLLRPVSGADWPAFWLRANAYFGGCVDPATKDSSRIFYLPSCPPGATHETRQQHGNLLDPDELPEVPTYTPVGRRSASKPSVFKRGLAEWAQRFAVVKSAELGSMPQDSGRNAACNRLAYLLGGLVAEPMHDIQPEWVVEQLLEACHHNGLIREDGERSVRATIQSGLESGLTHAWSPADQEPVQHSNGRAHPTPIKTPPPARESRLRVNRMFDIEPAPVSWLWRGRLARGKPTLLIGDPGLGKSLFSHWLAAQVSVGAAWPDRNGSAELGAAVLFTIEDGLADTVKPRLMAAGADTRRVLAVQGVTDDLDEKTTTLDDRLFTLEEHIGLLEELVAEERASLVVFDPITAYLGANVNSHRESDVRRVLGPLGLMAERTGVALLLLMHLNKGTGVAALYRAAGSIAFPAVARIVLGVAPDPNDETGKRRLLLPIKLSVGQAQDGLGYHIERTSQRILERVNDEDQPPVMVWDEEPVLIDATSAMDRGGTPSETTAVAAVKQTLTQLFLAAGVLRLPSADCMRALKDNNNSTSGSVVDRVKKDLGIRSERDSPTGPWYWVVSPSFLARARAHADRNRETVDSVEPGRVTSPSETGSSDPSQQSPQSADSHNLPRAREGQEMRFCPACRRNLTSETYDQHLCPTHGECFDAHECDAL